jgi:hypothetical protein
MITVPKPCHENWDQMHPREKGRLCDKCCKVVVDFTQKTTNQIVDFLKEATGQKVCGRFRGDQVSPVPVKASGRPNRSTVFLAALYMVFGSLLFTSCKDIRKVGEPQVEIMGKVAPPDSNWKTDTLKAKKNDTVPAKECHKTLGEPVILQGDVIYVPDTIK